MAVGLFQIPQQELAGTDAQSGVTDSKHFPPKASRSEGNKYQTLQLKIS